MKRAFLAKKAKLSTKSVLVCSDIKLGKTVATMLKKRGVIIKAENAAEDLGAAATAGSRRCVKFHNQRLRKGLLRSVFVGKLVKTVPKAKKLFKSGVRAQQAYGGQRQGCGPAQRHQARAAAANCAGPVGRHPCLTSTIAWGHGSEEDPEVQLQAKQLLVWLKVRWAANEADAIFLETYWRSLRDELSEAEPNKRWHKVCVAISATLTMLLDAEWDPRMTNVWVHPSRELVGKRVKLEDDVSIVNSFKGTIKQKLWKKAAAHRGGGGLETGEPFFDVSRKGSAEHVPFIDISKGNSKTDLGCLNRPWLSKPTLVV